ncbi:MAG TPA: N(4)-(beta-N-acetylglucosaminyl)-L-asparaginase [Candidatus Angelobacter sp.]|nr:N(4)-(beta-N-acetylglucosaminyl)-L-asparaginase [Candidatus Angelobacter sp.]
MKRRDFLSGLAVTSAATLATGQASQSKDTQNKDAQQQNKGNLQVPRIYPPKTIMISAANGITSRGNHLQAGYEKLKAGADTLEAAITTVTEVENDPEDDSVGLGGLPNEDCVVELDSCCMHGPSRRAGAVGAVHDIKNVASLARTVMEHTGHVMLVGEGASKFGLLMGFPKENLLTEHSRKIWQLWKEYHSDRDWWGPGLADPNFKFPANLETGELEDQPPQIKKLYALAAEIGIEEDRRMDAIGKVLYPPTGTINCSALNEKGEMSSVTTTSGLAWKIAGRCGDSPIIGAGCYCDQDVGAAGATGSGEENIKVCGAHMVVENLRKGMSPEEAGMDVLKRISRNFNNDMAKLQYVSMHYYILRKDGAYAGVTMWSGPPDRPFRFAIADGNGVARHETAKALYQGNPKDWPPMPRQRR